METEINQKGIWPFLLKYAGIAFVLVAVIDTIFGRELVNLGAEIARALGSAFGFVVFASIIGGITKLFKGKFEKGFIVGFVLIAIAQVWASLNP